MDNEATETEATETTKTEEQTEAETGAQAEDSQSESTKADEVVDKLQKRIGKEQAEKNDWKSKYEGALQQLKALQDGKDPNEDSEPDEKDKQIQALQSQIERSNMKQQARTVITEAGFAVPDALLDALVVNDDKQTLANVKAVIEYTNSVQSGVRDEFRKGHTPRTTGKTAKAPTKEAFDQMTPTEQLTLGAKDPELYAKLLNEE